MIIDRTLTMTSTFLLNMFLHFNLLRKQSSSNFLYCTFCVRSSQSFVILFCPLITLRTYVYSYFSGVWSSYAFFSGFLHLETGKHDSYFYIPMSSIDYVDYVLEEQLPGKKTYHFQYMIKSSKVTHVCTHLVI